MIVFVHASSTLDIALHALDSGLENLNAQEYLSSASITVQGEISVVVRSR